MHKNESLKRLNYSITFDTCRFSFFISHFSFPISHKSYELTKKDFFIDLSK